MSMKKRTMSIILALIIMIGVIPALRADAAQTYNVDAALSYAANNYQNYSGSSRCSEFVMDCLWTGGLKDVYGAQGSVATTLSSAKSGQAKDTGTLYRYLVNKGFEIEYYYASNGQKATIAGQGSNWSTTLTAGGVAQPGDCIFYFGDNQSNPQHFVICSANGGSSGYDKVYSVTPAYHNTVKYYGPGLDSSGNRLVRYIAVFHIPSEIGIYPDLDSNISVSDYLTYYATVTPLSATAVTKTNGVQTWKLPWTNSKDETLKLKTVSGNLKIINEIVNHAGNTWYEYETGTSTRGFIYSGDITIGAYYSNHTCTGVTADNAKIAATCLNPSKYTLKTGGFYYSTKPGAVANGTKITDNIPSSYQTATSIPCSYDLKNEYKLSLNSGTTYYYVFYVTDSSGKAYYSNEYSFTTTSIPVTSVSLSHGNSTLNIGNTLQLTATVSPSNASNKGVNWSSSNTSVATVSSSGLVTAKAKGSATITATAKDGSGRKASITVTVSCAHSSGYHIDAYVAPTCTKTGLTEGKRCKVCNETIVAQTTIPATGHSEVIDSGYAATCTASGLTDGKHCSVCGTVTVKQTTVPATGHSEVTDSGYAATCTVSGLTEGKHCSVCGTVTVKQTTIPATGHSEVIDSGYAATCTEDGLTEGKHCSVCGTVTVKQTIIPALGHDRDEWGTCSRCEDFYVTGKCGDNLIYEMVRGESGITLTISGKGEMYDYEYTSLRPWDEYHITHLIVEDGVTSIGRAAFYYVKLSNVSLPDSLIAIGDSAFWYADGLTSIKIPNSVTTIGMGAFTGIDSLEEITVNPKNTYYSSDSNGVLFDKKMTKLLCAPGALEGDYSIPDTVTEIPFLTFIKCKRLTGVFIPESVTYIAHQAFGDNPNLKTITFGGDAPVFEIWEDYELIWQDVTATVYYPSGNPTWTDDVKRDYGGNLTWVPYLDKLSNVTVTRTIPHTTGNILYWDAVECADIYQIYRLRSGETSWTLLKNTRSLGYKDETAVAGIKYYYKIVARNGDVKSDIKTTVSVGMVRPGAAVTRLDNVTIYKTIGHSSGNILYWNAVANAKIYQVYRLEDGQWVLLKNTGSLGYKDETARSGVKYYYKIVARNGDVKSDIKTTVSASATRP